MKEKSLNHEVSLRSGHGDPIYCFNHHHHHEGGAIKMEADDTSAFAEKNPSGESYGFFLLTSHC